MCATALFFTVWRNALCKLTKNKKKQTEKQTKHAIISIVSIESACYDVGVDEKRLLKNL